MKNTGALEERKNAQINKMNPKNSSDRRATEIRIQGHMKKT
jgi:hypothetical protein